MRLGLDYGGTKIEGIVLAPDGTERARARVPTPRFDYDGGLKAIRSLLERLEAEAGGRIESVGIGVPGSVDRATGYVSKGNSTWLHGRDLRGDLTHVLGPPGENRQRCQLLRPFRSRGRRRRRRPGGLWRHPRHRRRRRHRGARPAGRGHQRHRRRMGPHPAPHPPRRRAPRPDLLLRHPRPHRGLALRPQPRRRLRPPQRHPREDAPRAQEIVDLAAAGDAAAEETLRRYEDRLGRSLAVVVNILDPDVIVLGGGLSNVSRLYEAVPPRIQPHVFGDKFNTRLVQNVHGDSSGVRGAAWL